MDNPKSLNDYAYLFMKDKISEEYYVKKHPTNSKKLSWPETKDIFKNSALAFQYLRTFKTPGYRRKALSESMGMNATQLEYLFKSGTTTATDLLRDTNRRFDPNLLARYAIVHRSTYSIANAVHISSQWDFHVFDHLGECTITSKELTQIATVKEDEAWSINGYILTMKGQGDVYLRIEKKAGIVVVDLMNPSKGTFDSISSVLLSIRQNWYFLELPSFVIGHMFYVFISGAEQGELISFIKSQFGGRPCFKLTTIYSGSK
ncbi:hypothetical protein EDM56_02020 [Brevibacillus fluminis]|uniref:Uncharacterized protein n=1 Tax=Brevibacillus fluminis TaxID=511487 RepID=A0A3M8DX44_9BACL|nr:hypothetical protein [Brevibacillus fluminis]RNB92494.1 hypothetical protein EDM56_02020 [Brevibacillus fluminis]